MYSMVNSVAHYMSVNQAYMAALMAAPMVVIELIVARDVNGIEMRITVEPQHPVPEIHEVPPFSAPPSAHDPFHDDHAA